MANKTQIAFLLLLVISLVISSAHKKPKAVWNTKNIEIKSSNDYNIYAISIPKGLQFAEEQVPIESPDIKERIDRELLVNTYWQSNGLLLLKRANKFFPIIEPILKAEGVPDDFKYLAVIESGLTQAVSPASAKGFWQIMKGTAKEYGLEVNQNVDERFHIEKSTLVACKYLKNAKKKFGSWTLAAAAYNAGVGRINRELNRQNVSSYYDLLLGEETSRYIFRIIAVKEILSNPKMYGFNFSKEDLYEHIPTFEVLVDYPIQSFTKFAERYDLNYKLLKIHNPWLREGHLNNSAAKEYYIKIPREGYYR